MLLHLMVFGYPKNEGLSIEFKLIVYYDSYLIYELLKAYCYSFDPKKVYSLTHTCTFVQETFFYSNMDFKK